MARWTAVFAYAALILGTSELAGRAARAVSESNWRWALAVSIPLAAAGALAWALRRMRESPETRGRAYVALGAVAILCAAGLWRLRRWPAEMIHLLEYGLLGALCAWAFAPRAASPRAEAYGLILAAWIGLGDEMWQGVQPGRYYDLGDVLINVLSAGAGAALWRLVVGQGKPAK